MPALAPSPAARTSGGPAQVEANRGGWWGGFMRWLLGPIWYWLDLYDWQTGHPDHWKIIATGGYIFGLALIAVMMRHVFVEHADGKDIPAFELTFLVVYSALAFVTPYGIKGLKMWMDWRGSPNGTPPTT